MEKQRIVNNLTELGNFFAQLSELENQANSEDNLPEQLIEISRDIYSKAKLHNPWFAEDQVKHAFEAWAEALQPEAIEEWLRKYDLEKSNSPKKVGVIMAGNIPLVGLHDALVVLISGNELRAKLSSKDEKLMGMVLQFLSEIDQEWGERIHQVERLNNIDILIATGSDNSARYFEYYFKDTPRIIRKNRTAVAVLSEKVKEDDLKGLAKDVFTYFGLGCRNVTKVFIPKDFDLDHLFKAFYPYKEVINHNKYANNYDYNKAVYMMNSIELIENGFLLLKEDEALHSPVGVLFYERYSDLNEVEEKLSAFQEELQVVVSDLEKEKFKKLGEAQKPQLWDYADNVDTMNFLLEN